VAGAKALLCGLVAVLPVACSDSSPSSAATVSGALLLDQAVNGCEGESVLVQVRSGPGNVASESVDSATEGFDCAFRFSIGVPVLDCYEVVIDQQPVGRYPSDEGGGADLGVILAENVYGDPEGGGEPPLYADFDGCES
jgi:hypothetical protein